MVFSSNSKNIRYIACLLAAFIAVMGCYVKPVKANVAVIGELTLEGLNALFNIMGIAGIEFNNKPFSYDSLSDFDDEFLSSLSDEQIDRLNELGLIESETGSYPLTFSDVADTVSAFVGSVAAGSVTPTWLSSSCAGSYTIYAADVGRYKSTYDINITFDPDAALSTFGFWGGTYRGGYASFGIGVVLNPDYADTATFAYYYDYENGTSITSYTDLFSNACSHDTYWYNYAYNDYDFVLFYIGQGSYWSVEDFSVPSASDFDYAYLDGECANSDDVLQVIYDYIDGIDSTGYDLLGGLGIKVGSIIDSIVDGATSVSDAVADWLSGVTDLTADEVREADFVYTPDLQVVENDDDTYSVVSLGTGVISLDTDADAADTSVDDTATLDPDITADTTSELGILGSIWTWLSSFFTNLYNTLIKALQWLYNLWASGMKTILDAFAETLVGEGELDFSGLSVEGSLLADTFPFCIPFDIYDLFTNLVGTSKAPVVDFDFSDTVFGDINGGDFIISIDFGLDYFVLPIKVFRYFVLFGFIYALALKTRDLIRG